MQEGTSSATQSKQASAGSGHSGHSPQGPLRPIAIATLLGLLTAGLVVGTLQRFEPSALSLEMVAPNELDDAIASMNPKQSGAAAEEARNCKTPLAFVTLAADADSAPQTVRIVSGNYVSPPVLITPSPRRIAVPFPAPYPAGRGVLSVEGTVRGLTVALSPAWRTEALDGASKINVVWSPKTPC